MQTEIDEDTKIPNMTDRQCKIAARHLAIHLLFRAGLQAESGSSGGEDFLDLFLERLEGRLSAPELVAIEDEIRIYAVELLGKRIKINTVREILTYARNS